MFGSVFYNFWAALFSFAASFIWAIQNPFAMPLPTIGTAVIAAIIGFVVMYAIRLFIGYVFYTPEEVIHTEVENTTEATMIEEDGNQQFVPQSTRTTAEFEEANTEEMAQAVRTMLHGEEASFSR
ncbi:MAG: multidrug transporter [Solibacillus sp.]